MRNIGEAMDGGLAVLDDRGVVEVGGPEAAALLQRLVTNDVEGLAPGEARYAALLTPQGKILVDFLVVADRERPGAFMLDVPRGLAADLAKRLTLYRLRAQVTIADRSSELAVVAHADDEAPAEALARFTDPRAPGLWRRAIVPRAALSTGSDAARAAYRLARIRAAVPEGGLDFAYGDAFPHDANLDRLAGVDFRKGCYVGQEVVSRMQHRGTARKRVVAVRFEGEAPPIGAAIVAGEAAVGTMGSAAGDAGLALVRLDRAEEAQRAAVPLTVGDIVLDARSLRLSPRLAEARQTGRQPVDDAAHICSCGARRDGAAARGWVAMPDQESDSRSEDLEAEVTRLHASLADMEARLDRERRAATAEHARLTFELGHRVKNTLSVVQSLAGQTWRKADSREEALEAFGGRIIALSRANDAIIHESWTSVAIGTIAESALRAFASHKRRLTIGGPEVRLPAGAALSLAMALHELAVNAQRHGAWLIEGGRVTLEWSTEGVPAAFLLTWTESGGPEAAPPARKGFGLRLLEQSLRSAFGRGVALAFEPAGLRIEVRAPLSAVAA